MKILEVKLEYWVPGITIGASGAREENSFRDVTGICLNMHPGSFGGSKILRFDWVLASQSGCCSFDPSFLKVLGTRLRFY